MSGEPQDNWEDMDSSSLNQRMNSLVSCYPIKQRPKHSHDKDDLWAGSTVSKVETEVNKLIGRPNMTSHIFYPLVMLLCILVTKSFNSLRV